MQLAGDFPLAEEIVALDKWFYETYPTRPTSAPQPKLDFKYKGYNKGLKRSDAVLYWGNGEIGKAIPIQVLDQVKNDTVGWPKTKELFLSSMKETIAADLARWAPVSQAVENLRLGTDVLPQGLELATPVKND